MMICKSCGHVFENPRRIGKEQPVYSIKNVTDPEEYVCPECGSIDICDSIKCEHCGEAAYAGLCRDCMKNADEKAAKTSKHTREFYYTAAHICAGGCDAIEEYILGKMKDLFVD